MSWQTNNSVVISQGPCDAPGCRSSDAKTHYSDGHAYCFSCHTYSPAQHRSPMAMPYEKAKVKTDTYPTRVKMSQTECALNWAWLKKYGLTDEEIWQNFFYAPMSDRHVFAHTDEAGQEYFEARSVKEYVVPKTLSTGNKPTIFMGEMHTKTLVVVEDIVSAIKVGRLYGSMPLFGAFLSFHQMASIGRLGLNQVVIWLDCDKYRMGVEYARKLGMLVPTIAVQTKEDPKALDILEISSIIENAGEAMEAL